MTAGSGLFVHHRVTMKNGVYTVETNGGLSAPSLAEIVGQLDDCVTPVTSTNTLGPQGYLLPAYYSSILPEEGANVNGVYYSSTGSRTADNTELKPLQGSRGRVELDAGSAFYAAGTTSKTGEGLDKEGYSQWGELNDYIHLDSDSYSYARRGELNQYLHL